MAATTSHRGSVVDHRTRREHVYESRLEERNLVCAMASDDVLTIDEQVPTSYVDGDGVFHDHTVDIRLGLRDGRRVIVGVKAASRVEDSRIADVLRRIGDLHGTTIADASVIRTEEDVHSDDVADARLILHARRLPDRDADRVLAAMLPRLIGWCRLSHLADEIASDGVGFCAVVRAIAARQLAVRDGGRITPSCLVGPTRLH